MEHKVHELLEIGMGLSKPLVGSYGRWGESEKQLTCAIGAIAIGHVAGALRLPTMASELFNGFHPTTKNRALNTVNKRIDFRVNKVAFAMLVDFYKEQRPTHKTIIRNLEYMVGSPVGVTWSTFIANFNDEHVVSDEIFTFHKSRVHARRRFVLALLRWLNI